MPNSHVPDWHWLTSKYISLYPNLKFRYSINYSFSKKYNAAAITADKIPNVIFSF